MTVLSLFNGISCGRVALERANIPVERYVSYEIDKYANQVAKDNYPNDEYHTQDNDGDVTTADFTQYKGFDLLIGGSPCTYWSIAKKDREITSSGIGWELFMQYKRALVESGCKYFLYENNHSIHKDIKAEITKQLGVEPIMINSALVSAQQRKRCYWTNISGVEPLNDKNLFIKDIVDDTVEKWLSEKTALRPRTIAYTKSLDQKANCLLATMYKMSQTNGMTNLKFGDKTRCITPLECERLQTLPDNYTDAISNTQRYKAIGNGWTVDVIAHILSYIPNESNKTKISPNYSK